MKVDVGASVAVVVNRSWANLHGVKLFLRHDDSTQTNIRGVDESHVLFANVLDAEDVAGIWIDMQTARGENPAPDRVKMLIPWSQILTIVISEEFSPAIRQEARRISFTGETERE